MTVTGPVMTLQVRERDEVLEPYKLLVYSARALVRATFVSDLII